MELFEDYAYIIMVRSKTTEGDTFDLPTVGFRNSNCADIYLAGLLEQNGHKQIEGFAAWIEVILFEGRV
jgi:hypothetical protein